MSEARRAFLASEWRDAVASDAAVKNAYPLAQEISEETLLIDATAAATEATRRQGIRSILRHRYEVVLALTAETMTLDLGDVVSLTHDRYDLSDGELFRVIGLEPDAATGRLTVHLWGPSDPTSRLRVALSLAGTGTVGIPVTGSGGVRIEPALAGTAYNAAGTGSVAISLGLAGNDLA